MTATLKISGMSCQHCVNRVKKAVDALGVVRSDVQIGGATVEFDAAKLSADTLKKAVEEVGYPVISVT
ncbi:MAG TPA: heavy-metal-associated domain-containing protein [Dissulfurispiraceae bacterium]|nr:heavy-metal-associated domain-containing protein [Dissulfurispiraceae bacterium]